MFKRLHYRNACDWCLFKLIIDRNFNYPRRVCKHAVDAPWDFAQVSPFVAAQLMPLLRRGGLRFDDVGCEERIAALEDVEVASERTNLLYPAG